MNVRCETSQQPLGTKSEGGGKGPSREVASEPVTKGLPSRQDSSGLLEHEGGRVPTAPLYRLTQDGNYFPGNKGGWARAPRTPRTPHRLQNNHHPLTVCISLLFFVLSPLDQPPPLTFVCKTAVSLFVKMLVIPVLFLSFHPPPTPRHLPPPSCLW